MNSSTIPQDVKDRVIAAANELHQQSTDGSLPTVDAVRRLARADMNTTSTIMKEWRRAQTAQVIPVTVTVPEAVAQAHDAALAALWQQAQEQANESLKAAQAAWEIERVELDAMRIELANAFEAQEAELNTFQIAAIADKKQYEERNQQAVNSLKALQVELEKANVRCERAEAKAQETENRVMDLRSELERAYSDAGELRAALVESKQIEKIAIDKVEKMRGELAQVQTKLEQSEARRQIDIEKHEEQSNRIAQQLIKIETERDKARDDAALAREKLAQLAGEIKVHREQSAALIARITPADKKPAKRAEKPK